MNIFFGQTTVFAAAEVADVVFRWARIQENRDWFLPLIVVALLVVFFLRRYRIDAVELKAWQRVVLLSLRVVALVGLLLFYLHPQWEHLVGSSRVAVLLDTSASMGNRDLLSVMLDEKSEHGAVDTATEHAESAAGPTRLEAIVDWIRRSELFERLGEKHDVVFYSFDKDPRRQFVRLQNADEPTQNKENSSDTETKSENVKNLESLLKALEPDGEETALGEALFEVLRRERGQPLAGVVIVSDGSQNVGRTVEAPLETAARLHIPIYSIGVGQARQPLNFRVGNINVPERVFPGDPFTVRVPIEMLGADFSASGGSEGGENWTIPVELWMKPENESSNDLPDEKIGEKELRFSVDKASGSATLETEFDVRIAEPGKQRLAVKILTPKEDRNPNDDRQQIEVEVVDRKDRILLFASAPSRDYQFLCSQIYRDKSMTVDVFLPWAKPGVSQNADKILEHFPSTRTEMAGYDVVMAFDPNWRELSSEQIEILEHWVARQGGGLVLFAGPVQQADTVTGWVSDMNMDKIRALYPVEFLARQSAFDHRYHGDMQAWALKFSRAGEDADFLQPNDNLVESRTFWNEFPGFYGFFAVKGVKPTATLLAASGSPETMGRNEAGTLIAEQFYGAGRVLYFGSSELWRLRQVDERAFEQVATRILRHVAQGRLQRESDRGSLATDKNRYSLGSIAQLRVTANDAQLKPLTDPKLPLDVESPSGTLRTIEATLDPNVPGTYQTHLPLAEEGSWSIPFTIPDSDQQITRAVQVRMSDLERENPSRNETLLRELATKSDGVYYRSPTEALPTVTESDLYGNIDFFAVSSDTDGVSVPKITELLKIRSQRAVPDTTAEAKMLQILLILICAALLTEWTLRRFMKLA